MNADESGRRGLIVSAQTAVMLQGSTGFVSKLARVARQVDLLPILGDPEKRKSEFGESTTEVAREERATERRFGANGRVLQD